MATSKGVWPKDSALNGPPLGGYLTGTPPEGGALGTEIHLVAPSLMASRLPKRGVNSGRHPERGGFSLAKGSPSSSCEGRGWFMFHGMWPV